MKPILSILFFCSVITASANTAFDDYDIILTRRPFGATPAKTTAPPPASTVSPPSASAYRLSALFEGVNGQLCVGLVNKQNNKSMTLSPNNPANEVELIDADFENGTATLIENGSTYVLELTAGPPPSGKQITKPTNRNSDNDAMARRKRYFEKKQQQKRDGKPKRNGLRGAALKKHLQEYQMEVIRRGMPALPVPLTEESDRQLVEEGVLPAQ